MPRGPPESPGLAPASLASAIQSKMFALRAGKQKTLGLGKTLLAEGRSGESLLQRRCMAGGEDDGVHR